MTKTIGKVLATEYKIRKLKTLMEQNPKDWYLDDMCLMFAWALKSAYGGEYKHMETIEVAEYIEHYLSYGYPKWFYKRVEDLVFDYEYEESVLGKSREYDPCYSHEDRAENRAMKEWLSEWKEMRGYAVDGGVFDMFADYEFMFPARAEARKARISLEDFLG